MLNDWVNALESKGCRPKKKGRRWQSLCPAHDDKDPSLSISEGQGGKILVKCFGGCSFENIRDALGLGQGPPPPIRPRALPEPEEPPEPKPLPTGPGVTTFLYTDAESKPVLAAVRRDYRNGSKQFTQWTPAAADKPDLWIPKGMGLGRPLFRLPTLAPEGRVVVVEGEKCVLAYAKAWPDQLVTCWAGGTEVWSRTDWEPLRGREVWLLSDADTPGRKAMRQLAYHLATDLGCSVWIALPEGETKEDVADWIAKSSEEAAETVAALLQDYAPDDEDLHDEASSEGMVEMTAEKLLGHKLEQALQQHELTADGFADKLLAAEYKLLMLAGYKDRKGFYTRKPYHLHPIGIWVANTDKLKELLRNLAKDEVMKAYETGTLTQRVITQTMRMREAAADEAVKRLSVGAEGWLRDGDPRLSDLVLTEIDKLDQRGRYLGCLNGVVDLETGKLLKPADARRHMVTIQTGVEYDSGATHWAIDALTSHLDSELETYLWAVLGRAMWAQPDKTFVLIVGLGDSGKSTLFKAIGVALGPEHGTISEDLFRPTRGGKIGATPERESLVTTRIVTAVEAEKWVFDPGRLKAMAGSFLDMISIQPKYEAERKAVIRATILIAANDYPRLDLVDPQVVSRLRIVPYPRPQKLDPRIGQAITSEPEAAKAMLARLIGAARSNRPGNGIELPGAVTAVIKAQVEVVRGPFGVWIDNTIVLQDDGRLTTAKLWEAWAENCGVDASADDIDGIKRRGLARRVRLAHGINVTTIREGSHSVRGWYGIRLKTAAEDAREAAERVGRCSVCGEQKDLQDSGDEFGGVCADCGPQDQSGGPPPAAATGGASDAGATQPSIDGLFTGAHHPLTVEIERRLTQLASFAAELRADLRADPSNGLAVMRLDQCDAYRLGLEGFAATNPAFVLNSGHVAALHGAPALLNIIQFAMLKDRPAQVLRDHPPDWKGILWDLHRVAVERQREAAPTLRRSLFPRLLTRMQPRLKGF